jgi:hypothetical protein
MTCWPLAVPRIITGQVLSRRVTANPWNAIAPNSDGALSQKLALPASQGSNIINTENLHASNLSPQIASETCNHDA